jgi:hypothetical protein
MPARWHLIETIGGTQTVGLTLPAAPRGGNLARLFVTFCVNN